MKQFPNLVDYEAKLAVPSLLRSPPMPDRRPIIDDVEVKGSLFGGIKRVPIRRLFQAQQQEASAKKRASIRASASPVLNVWSIGPFSARTSRRWASSARTSCSRTTPAKRCGRKAAKYGSIDPCYPSKVAQAHIHNLLFHHHSDKKS